MPRIKKSVLSVEKPIEQYTHADKDRAYIPPAGLANYDSEEQPKQRYDYDPHIDPQLGWTGKAEHTSFEVPTVSLHVHERIDPRTIIEAVRKKEEKAQPSLFEMAEMPLRKAVEFYQHRQNWTNRLIAGDSLLVMNSLLMKEGMAGQVQMVYFDPPYGIKYGSNFQPFVNKRDVKDGKDEDLTQEPEMLKAFRDTWELGIHSYLTYLRDRLLLARELLHESGSIFVQISDANVHLVRNVLDEVFGVGNFINQIAFTTTTSEKTNRIAGIADYLVWYGKDTEKLKFQPLFTQKQLGGDGGSKYRSVEFPNGETRSVSNLEGGVIPDGAKVFRLDTITSQRPGGRYDVIFEGEKYDPAPGYWKPSQEGFERLIKAGRIRKEGNRLAYVRYFNDFPYFRITNVWNDLSGIQSRSDSKVYAVQTPTKPIERCMLMTTDPGDLVLDITCGSGSTAYVAEQWGRRWITTDTSRVAVTLAKQRLMVAAFDYYQLARGDEGISSGFKYRVTPHVTLRSIANNEPAPSETLYDQPLIDLSKLRVTSPFTVEAVPAPTVQALEDADVQPATADASIARSGETVRQSELRDELLRTGIRSKRGDKLTFSRVEPMSGTRFLHADAEVSSGNGPEPSRAVVSFSPEHHPLGRVQVARALEEANRLFPKPKYIIFAAYQFDPEAAKDIDETMFPGVTLLKAEINKDVQTADLKKKRSTNESFWLVGQPEVELRDAGRDAEGRKLHQVEVIGFDYFDTKEEKIISGGAGNIAVWMLDVDYDGRSVFPHQVFFPMSGEKDGWAKLARNLKGQIDEELIEAYRGTASLPFHAGEHARAAVKIVDDRGIESIKLVDLG
jgi:adenine-specific DNA-methyltransferase